MVVVAVDCGATAVAVALDRTRLLNAGETGFVSGGLTTLGTPNSPAIVNTLESTGLARNPVTRLARIASRSFTDRTLYGAVLLAMLALGLRLGSCKLMCQKN